MHRRPSLSSLSSTSGYASSTYGGGGGGGGSSSGNGAPGTGSSTGNATPQLSSQRLLQSRNFGLPNNSSNSNLQTWLQPQNTNQSTSSSHSNNGVPVGSVANVPKQQHINNVGPWVEQQQKQQQHSLIDSDKKEKEKHSANVSIVDDDDDVDDDELIPTAIVIKNIPFAIKKEQLLDVMTKLNLPLPYAFNYHFDNGVFRGLAFANFTSTDETCMVVNQLNGREIGGRKLRVEYKKMLPVQERERIEREKREKRGQLEEQHRSNSTALLASLLSAASTSAATKTLSVSGNASSSQTERVLILLPSSNLPLPPSELNFNDPEVLELYSQLLVYRDDSSKSVFELGFPPSLTITQRKILTILCSYLNLLELYDNGVIIVRRKPGHQPIQQRHQQNPLSAHVTGSGSSAAATQSAGFHTGAVMSMAPLNQTAPPANGSASLPHPPELLRSQSQSALPVPRMRQQASTPVQQQFPPYQQSQQNGQNGRAYQPFLYQQVTPQNTNQQNLGTPTSAAALLRSSNNRLFDMRGTPPLSTTLQLHPSDSPTPQSATNHSSTSNGAGQGAHGQLFNSSQPSTPLGNNELNSRFAPFGQHLQLTGSFTLLQPTSTTTEDFPLNESVQTKFAGLNLGAATFESNSATLGIWGPK